MSVAVSIVSPGDVAREAGLELDVAKMVRRDKVKIAAFPTSVARLSRIVRSDKYTIADLVDVVSKDQVLSAYILRYANSAAVRGVGEVSRLSDAILRLGSRETMAISVAIGLGAQVVGEGPLKSLRHKVWTQSTFAALFCRSMAGRRGVEEDHAFLCGLLFNFGTCVALACIERGFKPKESTTFPAEFWMDVAQRYAEELGELLAEKWNLPALVVSVLAAQHELEPDPAVAAFVDLIELATDVGELVERSASVSVDELSALASVRDRDEAEFIASFLPDIPKSLHEMTPSELPELESAPAPAAPRKTRKRVSTPRRSDKRRKASAPEPVQLLQEPRNSTLGVDKRDVDFLVLHNRAGGNREYRCSAVHQLGLRIVGEHDMPSNSVVKLTLDCPPEPLEVFCIVSLSRQVGAQHEIELRPMALNGTAKARWDQLNGQSAPASDPSHLTLIGMPVPDSVRDTPAPSALDAPDVTLLPEAAPEPAPAPRPVSAAMPVPDPPLLRGTESPRGKGTRMGFAAVTPPADLELEDLPEHLRSDADDSPFELMPESTPAVAAVEPEAPTLLQASGDGSSPEDWDLSPVPLDTRTLDTTLADFEREQAQDQAAQQELNDWFGGAEEAERSIPDPTTSQLFEGIGVDPHQLPTGDKTGAIPLIRSQVFRPPEGLTPEALDLEPPAPAPRIEDKISPPPPPSRRVTAANIADPHNLHRGAVTLNRPGIPMWVAPTAVATTGAGLAAAWWLFLL